MAIAHKRLQVQRSFTVITLCALTVCLASLAHGQLPPLEPRGPLYQPGQSPALRPSIVTGSSVASGQITRGFAFHGDLGYAAGDQLRLTLPSSQLDNFIRDSSGLPQIIAGQGLTPSAYSSPFSTVSGPYSAVGRGANSAFQPPVTIYSPPKAQLQLYDSALQPFRARMLDLDEDARRADWLLPGGAKWGDNDWLFPGLREPPQPSPGMVDMFAVLHGQYRQPPEPKANKQESKSDSRDESAKVFQPGQDVFVDLLVQLQRRKIEQDNAQGQAKAKAQQDRRDEQARRDREQAEQALKAAGGEADELSKMQRTVEYTGGRIVLHRLDGSGKDPFNRQMLLAQQAINQGEYKAAVECYEGALKLNSDNPLPQIGSALAMFAANEPVTAARRLREAMKRFPPMMQAAVDVNGIVGQRVADTRLRQLAARIQSAEKPEPEILFLAAFIHSCRYDLEQAAAMGAKLKAATDDEVYKQYADFLAQRLSTDEEQK